MSDREAVRVQIGQLLENALAQAGLAQAVYAYLEADFGTQTPVVMLASAGAELTPLTAQGGKSSFLYDIHVYVLYAMEDGTWTAEQSAQRLDRIYNAIAVFLSEPTNRQQALWRSLRQAGPSQVVPEAIGGYAYWHEVVPIRVEV